MFIELIVNNKLHTIGLKLLDPGSVYMIQQDLLPFLKKKKKKEKKEKSFPWISCPKLYSHLRAYSEFSHGKRKGERGTLSISKFNLAIFKVILKLISATLNSTVNMLL